MILVPAVVYGAMAVVFIASVAGLAWAAIGWRRTMAADRRHRDIAAPEECLYCRCLYMDADCTCPRRCTAMVCLAPAEVRRG